MISRTLQQGSTGSDVSQLETKLKALKLYLGKIDGVFGPVLKAAVIAYQKIKGLVQDGIAGPITLTSLGLWQAPVVKPYPIPDIEKLSGMTINSMTDLYNIILKIGVYNHINCLQGATTDTIVQGIKEVYNNCARYAYLGMKVSTALNQMGKKYTTRIVHVECENSKHFPDPNAGHFFLFIQGEEFPVKTCYDLAEAASGKRGIGSTMCINGYSIIGYDKLC